MSLQDIEWRKLGACRGLDASIFYPDEDDDAEPAKAICAGCGVRVACLEYALSSREKAGVWGARPNVNGGGSSANAGGRRSRPSETEPLDSPG